MCYIQDLRNVIIKLNLDNGKPWRMEEHAAAAAAAAALVHAFARTLWQSRVQALAALSRAPSTHAFELLPNQLQARRPARRT